MPGPLTIGGLTAGLDTAALLDELVRAERRPLDLLARRAATLTATRGAVAGVGTRLAALLGAAAALRDPDQVLVRRAESSDPRVLLAAAGAGAVPGTTTVTVMELARASLAASTVSLASAADAVASGSGTFAFRVGGGPVHAVAVDAATTLGALAAAIDALDAGVTARAVDLGTAASPDWRLEVVSDTTGAAATITVLQDDTALAVAAEPGLDAMLAVSGRAGPLSRPINTIADVLPGVTLTLTGLGAAAVTVREDADAVVGRARALVEAFNALAGFVADASSVDTADDGLAVGSLATDGGVRRLVDRVRAALSAPLVGASGPLANLASAGITTGRDGRLRLDEARLRDALARDPAGVAALFAGNGSGDGAANAVAALVEQASGAGGLLDRRTTALDRELHALEARIAAGERRLEAFAAGLGRQLGALESLLQHLETQSAFLAAFGQR